MKVCGRCRLELPTGEFGFRSKARGTRHSICLACHRFHRQAYNERKGSALLHARAKVHTARYRDRNRLFVDAYLRSHPCVDCGESDIAVLEFDHVRGSKEGSISAFVADAASLETLRLEIEKCDVRCANCHRRRTAAVFHVRRTRLAAEGALRLDEVGESR